MSYFDMRDLMALANLALASTIVVICMCRIDVMSRRTLFMVRVSYSLLLVAAGCSGLQPLLFREWPGWADLVMNVSLLLLLSTERRMWRGAPPEPYNTEPAELDEEQHVHIVGGKGSP